MADPRFGAFIGTTENLDVGLLQSTDVNSEQFKQLIIKLYQTVNNIALLLNKKHTGMYTLTEFVNGKTYFANPALSATQTPLPRQEFSITVITGQLPNTATKIIPHGISNWNSACTLVNIWGAATDTTGLTGIGLPYASPTLANNIELSMDATNIYITTGSNRTNYNISYVTLEYLKN